MVSRRVRSAVGLTPSTTSRSLRSRESRRTRARLELVLGVLTLGFEGWRRQFLRRHADDHDHELTPLSPSGVAVGALSRVLRLSLSDRDVWRIRTSRRRGLLFGLSWLSVQRLLKRASADPEAFDDGYLLGTVVGTVCYRCWYGLLRPLPGSDP